MSNLLARLGRWVFPRRLVIWLPVVLLGLLIVRPHELHGARAWLVNGASLLLVLGGLALRAWGGGIAGLHTRTDDISAPRLVTGGPFAYVRNPIYLGSMVMALGMVGLLHDPWLLAIAIPGFAVVYSAIIPAEEEWLRGQYGREYEGYSRAVPRILPRLQPWPGREERPFDWRGVRGDVLTACYLLIAYLAIVGVERLRGL